MSFQFPQPCPQPRTTRGPRITSRCFWKSLGGLVSAFTQCLLCPTVQKPGSSKVIPRSTVLRFVCCCVFVFFFLHQGKVMTLLQGHQDEECTLCVSKHRKVSCLAKDILFGPDPSYSPGPAEETTSWALTLGLHVHLPLVGGSIPVHEASALFMRP